MSTVKVRWLFEKIITPEVTRELQFPPRHGSAEAEDFEAHAKIVRVALRRTLQHFDAFAKRVVPIICERGSCPGYKGDPTPATFSEHPEDHTCRYAEIWMATAADLYRQPLRED